jgi:hypothetical protein
VATTATVSTSAANLQVTLLAAKTVYERNAIVPIRLSIRNDGRHSVTFCRGCVDGYLGVTVVNRQGKVLFPPTVPQTSVVSGGGPGRPAVVLGPGNILSHTFLIVLRGPLVRSYVHLNDGSSIYTKALKMHLLPRRGPIARLVLAPRVAVQVSANQRHSGPLLYSYSYTCEVAGGTVSGGEDWVKSNTLTIVPHIASCDQLLVFHLITGWKGATAARVDFRRVTARGVDDDREIDIVRRSAEVREELKLSRFDSRPSPGFRRSGQSI